MDVGKLDFIMNVCLGVGFAVPLLNLIVDGLDLVADLDADFDADTSVETYLPFNMMSLCMSLIIFGAVGKYIINTISIPKLTIVCLIADLVLAFIVYVLFYRLVIRKLKKNAPKAISDTELVGLTGKLTLRVNKNSYGTIVLEDSTGASLTYPVRLGETDIEEIAQGEKVMITDFDKENKVCYVVPFDEL